MNTSSRLTISRLTIATLTFALLATGIARDTARADDEPVDKKAANDPPAKKVKVGDITLTVPAAWKQEPPANRLRLAQFEIPAAGDDKEPAELSIFNFGAGGGVDQQVERWKGQFLPDRREFSMQQGKIDLGEYVLVELAGTYKKPVGPPVLRKTQPMPGAAMRVAMIKTEMGVYFLKLVGPEATVTAAAADFRDAIGIPEKKKTPPAE